MQRRHFFKSTGLGLAGLAVSHPGAEAVPKHRSKEATQARAQQNDELKEINNQIRREKFDRVLPEAMRKNHIDMWIHVMRETIPDPFGAEDLGSTSGVFVFSDRGSGRIERAILERRWGASQAPLTWPVDWDTKVVEECGAYDIVEKPILVNQPAGGRPTEYDYRGPT